MDLDRLRAVPIFSGLSEEELAKVSEFAEEVTIQKDKILTFQGEYAYKFFVILEGEASVTRQGQPVRSLGPGDFFGEIGLLESEKRTATVASDTDMKVIVLMGWDLREIEKELPTVGKRIRQKLRERLDADTQE